MIKSNTGKGKKNHSADIAVLQLLFKNINIYKKIDTASKVTYSLLATDAQNGYTLMPALAIDGKSDISARIEAYQHAKKMKVIDGWVGPAGSTIKALLLDTGVAKGTTRMAFVRGKITPPLGTNAIKPTSVITLYEKQYSTLSSTNKTGLEYILKTAKADSDISLIPELAYMLATTKHETAHTFRAIGEYGKGSGRSYGAEITVIHTDVAKKITTNKNIYYGRGYVQITWGYNYQRIDEKLGNGTYPNKNKTKAADYNKGFTITKPTTSIYLNPDNALKQENAYVAMVYGMQKGIFTGKKVSNYITRLKVDYINARRVINGTDKSSTIASYAENFEILLLVSTL